MILLKNSTFRNPRPRSCERGYIYQRLTEHSSRVRKNVGVSQRNQNIRYAPGTVAADNQGAGSLERNWLLGSAARRDDLVVNPGMPGHYS